MKLLIKEGLDEQGKFWITAHALNQNESYTFHIKIDRVYTINTIRINAINYTYWIIPSTNDSDTKQIEALAFYYFSTGELHDLLAVINQTGDTITITRLPEPEYPIKVDFF